MTTHNPEETEAFGAQLAPSLRAGDCLCLLGSLGAGKTAFTRGIARGLGHTGVVASPTFTLLNMYDTVPPLYHFDLYRLESAEAFEAAGLSPYVGGEGIAVIEWPEKCMDCLPENCRMIHIDYTDTPGEREITL